MKHTSPNLSRIRLRGARITLIALLTLLLPTLALAKIRIVTTSPTYADIARRIGGDDVTVFSIMRGPENPHHVIPKPSYMMKMRRADLFIHTGLDAEPWVPQLIKGARQQRFLPGESGDVNVSFGIHLLEVPKHNELSRALGDIHVFGNPHFTMDPRNGIIVARTITNALKGADPARAEEFETNFNDFKKSVEALDARLEEKMAPYKGTPVVTYHRFWPYFLDRFGLIRVGDIEPKPGIVPGPQHLARVVQTMHTKGVKIVIYETFNSKKNAQWVAQRADGVAVACAQEVDAVKGVDSYEKMFEYNVDLLIDAFKKAGVGPGAGATDVDKLNTVGANP